MPDSSDGFSIDDENLLSVFDPTYEKSEMIRGIRLTQKGTFDSRSKTVSCEDIQNIINKTHEKIVEAMNNILSGNFPVNPKILKGDNKSCTFCSFKDICYHTEKDKIYLDDYNEDNIDDM